MDLETLETMRLRMVRQLRGQFGDDAEDAVAAALARLALHIAAGDGERIEPGYVRTACHNAAVDLKRAEARRRESPGVAPEYHGSLTDQPDEGYAASTSAALDAMTDRQREVVALRADGYSGSEIAEQLGITDGGVKKLLVRARGSARRGMAKPVQRMTFDQKLLLAERELDRMMEQERHS